MGGHKQENKGNFITRGINHLLAWLGHLMITILSQGHVPRHVAFIMDGNRRFAKKRHVKTIEGHTSGFDTLEKILKWCMDLGVQEVTIYAFSIENFKRSQEEVDGLMNLTAEKLGLIMQENQMIDKLGIRVRVMGDLTLLPQKLRETIQRVVEYSRDNTRATLNVCLSYTSRDEMTRAVRKIADTAMRAREVERTGLRAYTRDEERLLRLVRGGDGALVEVPQGKDSSWGEGEGAKNETEMSKEREEEREEEREGKRDQERGGWGWEDELWNAMEVDSAPELLVRTSGEIRFSDFLLWQTAFSYVVFLKVLWPDFSIWHLLYVILLYQSNFSTMQAKRKYYVDHVKNRATSEKESEREKGKGKEMEQEMSKLCTIEN